MKNNNLVEIPVRYFKGIYNKISMLADMDGSREVLNIVGEVAFIYGTLLAYPDGLTQSECGKLGLKSYCFTNARQLGIINHFEGGKYQAIPSVQVEDCIMVEAAILKAAVDEISSDAKRYYLWAKLTLKSGNRRVKDTMFMGTIADIFHYTGDVQSSNDLTFDHLKNDSLERLAQLGHYGFLSVDKEGDDILGIEEITKDNEAMQLAFRVNSLKDDVVVPEQTLSKPIIEGKSPNFNAFFNM